MIDIWKSPCGRMELRLGRWQDVLADVTECDAVITDPPYSERTHAGNSELGNENLGCRSTLDGYAWLTPDGVREIVAAWIPRLSGWFVAMTDDALSMTYRDTLDAAGWFAFASVSLIQHRPRLVGDGPGSCTIHIQVARPRKKAFLSWGSLPGWYKTNPEKGGIVNGAKPLSLMQRIVGDYSRPGDLIVDPYVGGGTTLLAAAIEGRRAIGAEMCEETYRKAVRRLSAGYTPSMFSGRVSGRVKEAELPFPSQQQRDKASRRRIPKNADRTPTQSRKGRGDSDRYASVPEKRILPD